MSGGGTQNSLRRALGALKDSTTVSLAKVNSDYKELDIAIVKATNHYERPARERHIRAIFAAVSATRPRADVAYCIHALARRLSRTHNWAVALKTLIVIHRALREVDQTFHEEIINYGRSRSHMLNMAHFKDDSSPNAWDYSAWVRTYALFLEERLECFRVLKYDVEMDRPRTKDLDTVEILEQLPALQQLLFRILGCQPQGAAVNNFVIQLALQLVASESIRVYQAINDATANLVDKFFEMQRHDAAKALEIYRRACQQAERLSEFYEICKSMNSGRGEKFINIEQPPLSFLQTMEEYVRDAPRGTTSLKDKFVDNKIAAPKEILAIEYKKEPEVKEERPPSPPPPEPVKVEEPVAQPPDLLGLDDPVPVASELDEKNALALAIVPVDFRMTGAQREHVLNIEHFVPSLAQLRNNLRSEMGDGRFWMVYFVLLIPRLNEHDYEVLSTPQIVETRNVLLQKLQNKRNVKVESSNNSKSATPGEITASREEITEIADATENFKINEENSKQFSKEKIDNSTSMDNKKKLEDEQDVSFSDLEDDDSDFSVRLSASRKTQSIRAPSPSGSSDWIQLNEGSDTQGGPPKARQSFSRDKDSDAESSDWHKVDEFD